MNKNSNSYQIIYSAIMVVLVGAVLALIYMNLKPKQDVNIANDTRSQILSALHIAVASDDEIPATYEKYITQDLLVDLEGNVLTENGIEDTLAALEVPQTEETP